jgi:hypothetical protein
VLVSLSLYNSVSVSLNLCLSISLSLSSLTFLSHSMMFYGTHSNNIDSILAEGFKMDAVVRYHPKGEFFCSSHCCSVIMSLCVSVSLFLCLSIFLFSLSFSLSLSHVSRNSLQNIDSILAEGFKMDAIPRYRPKGEFSLFFVSLSPCISLYLSLFLSISLSLSLSL